MFSRPMSARLHYTAAKGCLARLCAAAKIEGVTPHTLRHTFGSVAGDLGFSELTIAALLGHAARGVTQSYVHIDAALKLAATRTCAEISRLLAEQRSRARPACGAVWPIGRRAGLPSR